MEKSLKIDFSFWCERGIRGWKRERWAHASNTAPPPRHAPAVCVCMYMHTCIQYNRHNIYTLISVWKKVSVSPKRRKVVIPYRCWRNQDRMCDRDTGNYDHEKKQLLFSVALFLFLNHHQLTQAEKKLIFCISVSVILYSEVNAMDLIHSTDSQHLLSTLKKTENVHTV